MRKIKNKTTVSLAIEMYESIRLNGIDILTHNCDEQFAEDEFRHYLRTKFVDEFYFPLDGLPAMNIFHEAGGHINIVNDTNAQREYDEFATTIRKLANLGISLQQNCGAPSKMSDVDPIQNAKTTSKPKTVTLRSTGKFEFCVFCKNNNEPERVYRSHKLKDNRDRVQCPRLRNYTCKICGASGDYAHTIRYCPKRDNFYAICL